MSYVPDSIIKQVDDSQIPTEAQFQIESEVDDVVARWKFFGKALHINPAKLDNIEAIQNIKPEECLSRTLTQFLNMSYDYETHGLPSWKLIVIALAHKNGGNNPQLALRVAGAHGATISGHSSNGSAATGATNTSPKNDILNEKPDLKHLGMISYVDGTKKAYRPIEDISMHWEAVAQQLKVPNSKIHNARRHHDSTGSASEVIQFWLGSNPDATWLKLIKAMKAKDELKAAAKTFKKALINMIESEDEESDDD